jgi:hypothetical protein
MRGRFRERTFSGRGSLILAVLAFAVDRANIYYGACGSGPETLIHQLDPKTNRRRILGGIKAPFRPQGLAVSPEGKTILILRGKGAADLMLIENFR